MQKYGNDIKIVFIGPCVAKKAESNEIDEAITFTELREMFTDKGISAENAAAGRILISLRVEEELSSLLPGDCFRQPR